MNYNEIIIEMKSLDLDCGIRVFIYRNLHKNLYSVRGPEGKIIAYTNSLLLANVKYCVGEKGRERVLRTKQKNVHAGLRGNISFLIPKQEFQKKSYVMYDPYKYSSFVFQETEEPIYNSDFAILTHVNKRPIIMPISAMTDLDISG